MGILGIALNKKSLIHLLFSIELMLLSVNLNFLFFSRMINDISGHIINIFILTVAAAETAIGLAIIMMLFTNNSSMNLSEIDKLKG